MNNQYSTFSTIIVWFLLLVGSALARDITEAEARRLVIVSLSEKVSTLPVARLALRLLVQLPLKHGATSRLMCRISRTLTLKFVNPWSDAAFQWLHFCMHARQRG